MNKSLFILTALGLASLPAAHATSVTWGGTGTNRTVVDSSLIQLAADSLVLAGTFANESFTFNSSLSISDNYSAIVSAGLWKQFTLDPATGNPDATINNSLKISSTGKAAGVVTDNNGSGSTQASFFNGKPIYLWIFNVATPSSVTTKTASDFATTIAGATQMGIFRATDATPTAWNWPTNSNGVGDAITIGTSSTSAPTMLAIGGAGSTTSTQLQLVSAVPEPGTLTLGALAGLGLLASRRRKQRK